jgi:hypothetical protein
VLAIAGAWMHPVARISCQDVHVIFDASKVLAEFEQVQG